MPFRIKSIWLASAITIILIKVISATIKPASQIAGRIVLIEDSEFRHFNGLGDLLRESGQLQNGSSSIRLRRQSQGTGPISLLLDMTCPDKSASEESAFSSASAEILFHRSVEKDDISIAESKSGAQFELSVNRLLTNADFQSDKPTLVYMPGWMQNNRADWLIQIRKSLDQLVADGGDQIGAAPVNLMLFDFSAYTSVIYARSVSMVPLAGKALANFLQQLIDKHSYDAGKIHIVSYSLSTHIAGIAGRLLRESGRGQLAQITAIDPTGVCFHRSENEPFNSEFGLKPGDAKLVLARHYDMNELGAGRPIGHVDVFVNGGSRQPRMRAQEWNAMDLMGSMNLPLAGHLRAILHEAAASDAYKPADCHEIAYKCASWRMFKRGQCADCGRRNESCLLISTLAGYTLGTEPQNIGYANGTQMHMMTGDKRFCTYNYQVVARLKRRPPISLLGTFEQGGAKFELRPDVIVAPMHKLNETAAGYSERSVSFTSLLRLGANKLKLPERVSCLTAEAFDWIESLEINYMSSMSPIERRDMSRRYCPGERDDLKLVDCR